MLQLVIENAGALALLVRAVAGAIKATADAVDKISDAVAESQGGGSVLSEPVACL